MEQYRNQIKHIASTVLPSRTGAADTIHKAGTNDGWHGAILEEGPFKPEADRYHLYIGLFCPFAHRVNLVRHLKGLTDIISLDVVKAYPKGDDEGWPGWQFPKTVDEYHDSTTDRLFGSAFLHEVYFRADKEYKGRYSVPVLWDKKKNTIVNTESGELLRWLPTAFNSILPEEYAKIDLYPPHLRAHIDAVTAWMQPDLNIGVYKTGFAPDQETYDKNVIPVFAALNKLEEIVHAHGGPYLLGNELTELDIRLYATLIRFDVAYVQHFKCNLGTIRHDYPNLHNWLKNLYWNVKGFKETTNFRHIKENYTKSHPGINPKAITPMGPFPDIDEGFEPDFLKLPVGAIKLPAVVERQATLESPTTPSKAAL
ncbi:glutathione S-transferase [Trichodelitschia bisporula]|uniref:Glutathione S-transferase n=1 Tax=Trichodelitschia bisporula TaxID=703511 RepID=A0A6G1HQ77_9PEZI|nr:glutathione S-transferase [Trichodelitschia bisporula]